MSTSVTWLAAHATTVEVVKGGTEMPDSQQVSYHLAVVLAADEVVVLEGSRDRLATILGRALAAVEAQPVHPHRVPDGTQLPTHVPSQADAVVTGGQVHSVGLVPVETLPAEVRDSQRVQPAPDWTT